MSDDDVGVAFRYEPAVVPVYWFDVNSMTFRLNDKALFYCWLVVGDEVRIYGDGRLYVNGQLRYNDREPT